MADRQNILINGLAELGDFLRKYAENPDSEDELSTEFSSIIRKSETENAWFTTENQLFAIRDWGNLLQKDDIERWTANYQFNKTSKKVGLILAGNIPLVGFHDVVSTVLSNHIPVIKLSSKDRLMIPFLLKLWNKFSEGKINYEIVERLQDFDAVIATGSNNTARYLEFYFKNHLSIIRKNRTSIAVLKGDESDEELRLLAEDIFTYYGLGCRNVTRLFIPENFLLDRIFENFVDFGGVINHHKYANNYDYNKAIYLLNQEKFWDNNFVMLREDEGLFSPLSVINFSRYKNLEEVKQFISENAENIQAIVAKPELGLDSLPFGEAQHPSLDTYADNVDTMKFLEVI